MAQVPLGAGVGESCLIAGRIVADGEFFDDGYR